MSSDRELLELAAKAAGIKIGPYPARAGGLWDESDPSSHKLWNPLQDDGDALRLAVKLWICIDIEGECVTASIYRGEGANCIYAQERCFSEISAATRRAIVRAAAELGRRP